MGGAGGGSPLGLGLAVEDKPTENFHAPENITTLYALYCTVHCMCMCALFLYLLILLVST